MHKLLQHLLLFEKFEIQTKLPKREILRRMESLMDPDYSDYGGSVSEGGFWIYEKNQKTYAGGRSHNSFAPVATAAITEGGEGGLTVISGVLRMNLLVQIVFVPIYLISLLFIFPFLIELLILHFAFWKPAKGLKEHLEYVLQEP